MVFNFLRFRQRPPGNPPPPPSDRVDVYHDAATGKMVARDAHGAAVLFDSAGGSGGASSTDELTTSGGTADAAAGALGEYISDSRTSGSPVTLAGITAVLEVTLTPGDWDVQGHLNLKFDAATVTTASSKITQTVAVIIGGSDTVRGTYNTTTATEDHTHSHPSRQIRVTTTTTYYLNAFATTSAGTVTAFGFLAARRVR